MMTTDSIEEIKTLQQRIADLDRGRLLATALRLGDRLPGRPQADRGAAGPVVHADARAVRQPRG